MARGKPIKSRAAAEKKKVARAVKRKFPALGKRSAFIKKVLDK